MTEVQATDLLEAVHVIIGFLCFIVLVMGVRFFR